MCGVPVEVSIDRIMERLHIHAMEFHLHAEDSRETWESLKTLEDLKNAVRILLYLQYGEWAGKEQS